MIIKKQYRTGMGNFSDAYYELREGLNLLDSDYETVTEIPNDLNK